MITLNGEPLAFEQPEVLTAPHWRDPSGEARRWKVPIDIRLDGGRRVEGWAALRARGSTTRAGFALLRRDRVIEGSADETYRPRDLFGASNSFTYQRLFGELSLVGFAVSHTKDGIRWGEAEDDLIFRLKELLSREDMPVLDQAQNWRAGELAAPKNEGAPGGEKLRAKHALPGRASTRITSLKKEETEGRGWRNVRMQLGSQTWDVQLVLSSDGDKDDWLLVHSLGPETNGLRCLQVTLSMRHPFSENFVAEGGKVNEGVARLVTGLAIAEAIAQEDGVRSAGRVRSSLNELLLLGLADA